MLLLNRKVHESIVIVVGDVEIKVFNMGLRGGQVILGVEAPRDVPVHRQEVYERIKRGETE